MHSGLIEKALEIAEKRRRILKEMRRAVRAGDKDSVLVLARKLTGLGNEKRRRTNPRLN